MEVVVFKNLLETVDDLVLQRILGLVETAIRDEELVTISLNKCERDCDSKQRVMIKEFKHRRNCECDVCCRPIEACIVDNLVAYRCNNAENISTIIIAREDDVLAVVGE